MISINISWSGIKTYRPSCGTAKEIWDYLEVASGKLIGVEHMLSWIILQYGYYSTTIYHDNYQFTKHPVN